MTDTTPAEVESQYGDHTLGEGHLQRAVDRANRLADQNFSGRLATVGETEGSEQDFKTFLACHFLALREGELQSESQAGGSVSYNVVAGDVEDGLSETRFGRMAKTYLRNQASIATVVSRSR